MLTRTVVLDESLSFKMHLCGNVSHTNTHRHTLTQTHTLLSCVCMCVVCASVQSIFAPHLLMTLKPTRGGAAAGLGGLCQLHPGCEAHVCGHRYDPADWRGNCRFNTSTNKLHCWVGGSRGRMSEPWDRTVDAPRRQFSSKRRLRVCRSRLKGSFSHFLHICQFIVIWSF